MHTHVFQGAKQSINKYLYNTALKIIKIQSSPYLGEDNIKRFEDQFGRT